MSPHLTNKERVAPGFLGDLCSERRERDVEVMADATGNEIVHRRRTEFLQTKTHRRLHSMLISEKLGQRLRCLVKRVAECGEDEDPFSSHPIRDMSKQFECSLPGPLDVVHD